MKASEARASRGHLTIFFGAAPGVGKTYAMLEASRYAREEGTDVVVGIVETHGRYDTAALLLGLEILPRRRVSHKGIELEELDLDAAVARRPGLLLVDELAHTNAPGSRHTKRWQDVEEVLEAGIDVYTTMNVQHLESLVDVVAQITHVVVRETVPDAVFESADDVRLIDLPIDELLTRLEEGKVYVPEQARLAGKAFFREGNLIALREIALRKTAERVDAQMRRYREEHGIEKTWAVGERLLVCVSPSPASEALVRGARRLAGSLHADWIAVYVEPAGAVRLGPAERKRVNAHLELAQRLGAETLTLSGGGGPEEVVRLAQQRNVTRILVGKPTHPRWRDRFYESFLDRLVRSSGEIDVHVLRGDSDAALSGALLDVRSPHRRVRPSGIAAALVLVGAATLLGDTVFGRAQVADVVMVYLLAIVLVSLRWGLLEALFAAIASVLAFDFFFVPPYHTFAVADLRHIATFGIMFLVATIISSLTRRVRDQAEAARFRELRTASLYALSRALATAKTTTDVVAAGTKHVQDVFSANAAILLRQDGRLEAARSNVSRLALDDKERGVAEWVAVHGRGAGLGTETLPSSSALHLPLEGAAERVGVLAVAPLDRSRFERHDERRHLDAFASQIAASLERTRLAELAAAARLRVEAEQLRNSLLSSVSHDLRTPLAVITGTATTLLQEALDPNVRTELLETIVEESDRLARLVRNLLDMTRLEAGAVEVKKEWQPLEEAVGAALERMEASLAGRAIETDLPADLPLVPFDSVLLQQVLVNVLENAVKYTPSGSPITISASRHDGAVEVTVADRGPGLPAGEEDRIFEKFFRAQKGRGGGVGLGLTICRGIVTAHGGRIWATNRHGGGAAFHFTLPIEGEPPPISAEAPSSARDMEGVKDEAALP